MSVSPTGQWGTLMQERSFPHLTLPYPHFIYFTQNKKQNLANKIVESGPWNSMQELPSDIHATLASGQSTLNSSRGITSRKNKQGFWAALDENSKGKVLWQTTRDTSGDIQRRRVTFFAGHQRVSSLEILLLLLPKVTLTIKAVICQQLWTVSLSFVLEKHYFILKESTKELHSSLCTGATAGLSITSFVNVCVTAMTSI